MEGWFILAPGTAGVAAGLTVLALCSQHWTGTSIAYAGLWNGCVYVEDLPIWACGETKWPHDQWILAVKILVIASVGFGVFTSVLSALAFIKRSSAWSLMASVLILVQGLILVAGLFTFLGYICKYGSRSDLGWSYTLGWISVGFYVLADIFFMMQAKRFNTSNLYVTLDGV